MKMIVAVVRDEFATALTEQLTKKGFSATKLASTGGFLKAGNSTFLIGVPADQLDLALGIIHGVCPAKKAPKGESGSSEGTGKSTTPQSGQSAPAMANAGAATVFVIDVAKMVKV